MTNYGRLLESNDGAQPRQTAIDLQPATVINYMYHDNRALRNTWTGAWLMAGLIWGGTDNKLIKKWGVDKTDAETAIREHCWGVLAAYKINRACRVSLKPFALHPSPSAPVPPSK
jgi:hypothetical protein